MTTSALGLHGRPLTASIKKDHDELREYRQKYLATEDMTERNKWANLFRWELARHSVGEEIVWYPEIEKALGEDGKLMAAKDRAEHQQAKEDLAALENMTIENPDFEPLFKKLFTELTQHMEDEEQNDLPRFEEAVTDQDSERIATSFERMKEFVPTRAHPGAPSKPPFETVAGLLTMPIDKVRDMFNAFPTAAQRSNA